MRCDQKAIRQGANRSQGAYFLAKRATPVMAFLIAPRRKYAPNRHSPLRALRKRQAWAAARAGMGGFLSRVCSHRQKQREQVLTRFD